eukprot:m51a1_g14411 hypothetical protein (589) ;mRNA; f:438507-441266
MEDIDLAPAAAAAPTQRRNALQQPPPLPTSESTRSLACGTDDALSPPASTSPRTSGPLRPVHCVFFPVANRTRRDGALGACVAEILSRPIAKLSAHKDIPRLRRGLLITGANGRVLYDQSLSPNAPGHECVLAATNAVVGALSPAWELAASEAVGAAAQRHLTYGQEVDEAEMAANLHYKVKAFMEEVSAGLGDDCLLVRAFKCISQEAISPAVKFLHDRLFTGMPFKDVASSWTVSMTIPSPTEVVVTHSKRQRSRNAAENIEFEWSLNIQMFQNVSELRVSCFVMEYTIDASVDPARKAVVETLLDPLLHPISPYLKLWRSPVPPKSWAVTSAGLVITGREGRELFKTPPVATSTAKEVSLSLFCAIALGLDGPTSPLVQSVIDSCSSGNYVTGFYQAVRAGRFKDQRFISVLQMISQGMQSLATTCLRNALVPVWQFRERRDVAPTMRLSFEKDGLVEMRRTCTEVSQRPDEFEFTWELLVRSYNNMFNLTVDVRIIEIRLQKGMKDKEKFLRSIQSYTDDAVIFDNGVRCVTPCDVVRVLAESIPPDLVISSPRIGAASVRAGDLLQRLMNSLTCTDLPLVPLS